MLKRIFLALVAAWVLAQVTSPVRAEDLQFVSTTTFADMQRRLAEVESQLASYEAMGDHEQHGKGGKDGYCGTCITPGITLDAELLFLRPFGSDGGTFDNGNQYNPGVRLAGGFVRGDGLGLRARWFSYGSNAIDPDGDFDAYYADLELTDKFGLGCWEATVSGGLRYAEFTQPVSQDGMFGLGPQIGIELTRQVRSNLYLFTSARTSMLFGQEQFDNEDDTFSISEMQLGVEFRRDLGGAAFFVRTAVEGQYWSAVANDDEEDLGLIGGVFAVGITR